MDNCNYYKTYYSTRKHRYKIRYEILKIEKKAEIMLYQPYGGKESFYKNSLINSGIIIIKTTSVL